MSSLDERGGRAGPLVNGPGGIPGSATYRAVGFFGFWLVLTDADSGDLAAGLVAAVTATWASLRLMPAEQWDLNPINSQDSCCTFCVNRLSPEQTSRCARWILCCRSGRASWSIKRT